MTTPAATAKAAARLGLKPGLTLALEVHDLEKAKAWYQNVLGFDFIYEVPEIAWCELRSPTEHVTVGLSQVETVSASGGITPVFATTDIEAARSALEANGVRFDGPTQTLAGMVKLVTFYDPDGNPIRLSESVPR